MALKCADIGHLAASPHVHKRWALLLEEEFFLQVISNHLQRGAHDQGRLKGTAVTQFPQAGTRKPADSIALAHAYVLMHEHHYD